MEKIYLSITKETHTLKLPKLLCLSGYGCAVFKIKGIIMTEGDMEDDLYLCSNFSKDVFVENILLPVLTEIPWSRVEGSNKIIIDETFDKATWLPVTRDHVEEIQLYLCNSTGNIPTFQSVKLACKLVFIPSIDSL